MSTTSIGEYDNREMPASISKALCSMHTRLKENRVDDKGEIGVREQGLREKFESAHAENKRISDEFCRLLAGTKRVKLQQKHST